MVALTPDQARQRVASHESDERPVAGGHGTGGRRSPLTVAWYWWRATGRTMRRPALVVVLLTGLLGAVSMAALAGARRTESAYGRYLQSVRASDVMVNIPSTDTSLIAKVEHLPGVRSSAAFAGLAANPVVRGRVDDSFLTNSVESSVDGAFYRQDTLTVLSGRLPAPTSTNEIALTPRIATLFGVRVGGTVRYQLYDAQTQNAIGAASFRVTAVVEAPPALVDQFDEQEGAFLSPAATARYARAIAYSWVGIRLDRAAAGLPSFQSSLMHLSTRDRPRLFLRGAKDGHRAPSGSERHPSPGRRPRHIRRTGRLGSLGAGQPEPGSVARTLGGVTPHAPGLRPHPPRCGGDRCVGPRPGRGDRRGACRHRRRGLVTAGSSGSGAPVRSRARRAVRLHGAGGGRPDPGCGPPGPAGHDGLASGPAPPRHGNASSLGTRPGRRGRRPAPGGRPRHPVRPRANGRGPQVRRAGQPGRERGRRPRGGCGGRVRGQPRRVGFPPRSLRVGLERPHPEPGGLRHLLELGESGLVPRRRRNARPTHGVRARGGRMVDVRLHPAPHRWSNRARARTGDPPRCGGAAHRQRAPPPCV